MRAYVVAASMVFLIPLATEVIPTDQNGFRMNHLIYR
jgi:hypothetical protein